MKDILANKLKKKVFAKLEMARKKVAESFGGVDLAYPGETPLQNLGIYDPKREDMKYVTKGDISSNGLSIPKGTTIRALRSNIKFDIIEIFWHPKEGNVTGNNNAITSSANVSLSTFEQWKTDDLLEPVVPDPEDIPVRESIQSFKTYAKLDEDVVSSLRKIIKSDRFADVTFKDKSSFEVDPFSARNIIRVLDTLKSTNKTKMINSLNKDKKSFNAMVDFAFKNS